MAPAATGSYLYLIADVNGMRPAIQLYTLRECSDSVEELIELVGETAFEGVQFSGLGDDDPDELAAALDRTGLDAAGAHVDLDDIEARPDEIAETYATLGCDNVVVPSYDREAFESEDGARTAGQCLSEAADRLASEGIGLHYHNHTFKFTTLDGATAFDPFADAAAGVGLEIDVGLASHGGTDPVDLLDRYGDRVRYLHLTDSRAGPDETRHMDLGEGEVDLRRCVDVAGEAGVEWVIFEHGLTDDPRASMAHAETVLTDLLV